MSKNENDKQNSTKRKWEIDEYDTTDKYRNMIEKLADAERNSKLVVFVGAGVSISQGYPNWDGYVDHLIKYWQFNIQSLVSSENISRETILVFDKISRGSFSNKRKIDLVHQILKKLLGDEFEANQLNFEKYYFDDVRPFEPENKTLASLSNLDATFITSNYDTEIERHLDRKRKKPPVVRDLGEFQNTDVYLKISHVLHIHGTAKGNPHLLINSSSAYSRQYFRNRDKFEELVRWFEDSKPVVLFVGVSLEEDELLSLLVKENENFALMKADANANTKVDRDLRNYIEEFFYKENYTKIFWYGDDFDELPIVIKDIVSDIKKINKPTPQQEYWNELNTLETKDEEYLQILNSMLDNRKYHRTLNQFYEHISSSIE
ncbi:SIR2 family protein, partial [Enterococcus entomosocium]